MCVKGPKIRIEYIINSFLVIKTFSDENYAQIYFATQKLIAVFALHYARRKCQGHPNIHRVLYMFLSAVHIANFLQLT